VWTELLPIARDYGPFGLMALMVILGWLVPRVTHRERMADKDLQIERQDKLIATYAAQNSELMELARTAVAALDALPRAKEPL
jgi:hypothetical protein